MDKTPYSKTDTLYISTHQENIEDAIENLGNQFTQSIDSLTSSVTKLKSDERILEWVNNDALFATLTSILVKMQFINLNNHHIVSKENALTLEATCLKISDRFNTFTKISDDKKTVNT